MNFDGGVNSSRPEAIGDDVFPAPARPMRQGNAVGKWHVKTGIGVGLHRFGEPAGSPFISWDKWSSVGDKVTKQTN
ncbi:MAG: hypothetical protein CBB71_18125 [Rhodopirellula sp. TMED11]|nr:MAG: hypothetical protein CBB71_18125 [Rhodopirellula sp. TMED11]